MSRDRCERCPELRHCRGRPCGAASDGVYQALRADVALTAQYSAAGQEQGTLPPWSSYDRAGPGSYLRVHDPGALAVAFSDVHCGISIAHQLLQGDGVLGVGDADADP